MAAIGVLAARDGVCETLEYRLDLPPERMISYVLELDLREPGTLVVEADWSAERMLTFKLERPAGPAVRRTGLPPQKLEIDVAADVLADDARWTLSIRGLPSKHAGSGTLRLTLPEPPPATEPATATEAPPAAAREPWETARAAPAGAPPEQVRVHDAVERFRALTVDPAEPAPDVCRWQSDLLRYMAGARDGLAPDPHTARLFERMAGAVARVESFRTSDDPLLVPPHGADRLQQQAWEVVFQRRTAPVRDTLDDVLHDLHHGRAPELESEEWPSRFVSCLAACERHFEERRAEGDRATSNRRLAEDQWERILAAGQALEALSALARTD